MLKKRLLNVKFSTGSHVFLENLGVNQPQQQRGVSRVRRDCLKTWIDSSFPMERSNRSLLRLRLFVGMKSAEKSKGSSESARRLLVQFSSARFLSQTPVKLLVVVVAPLSSSSLTNAGSYCWDWVSVAAAWEQPLAIPALVDVDHVSGPEPSAEAVINRWLKSNQVFNMIMASDKTSAMTDLEDLNRTLYDIGAQDLLDVWEAMESVSPLKNLGFQLNFKHNFFANYNRTLMPPTLNLRFFNFFTNNNWILMPPIGVFAPVFCETVAYLSSVFLAIFETLEIWKIAEACRKSWICTSGNLLHTLQWKGKKWHLERLLLLAV